jgi:endonuclease/exonuclease/phosphatase family metal-dependent hydrolase
MLKKAVMQISKDSQPLSVLSIALYGLLTLFFLQLLNEFVEAVYAFGLLNTSLPPELVAVLILLSPLLLLLLPGGIPGGGLLLLGELVVICRAVEVVMDTRGRMLVSGLGAGAFLLFFPALLFNLSKRRDPINGRLLTLGLVVGVSLSIALRAFGSGSDPSLAAGWPPIAWLMALLAAGLLLTPARLFTGPQAGLQVGLHAEAQLQTKDAAPKLDPGKTSLLALGITSVWMLGYFALGSPNVIARWTGGSYLGMAALTSASLVAGALLVIRGGSTGKIPKGWLLIGSLLFTAALAAATQAHQAPFPHDPGAYPLTEPGVPAWGGIAWPVFLIAALFVWLDFAVLVKALLDASLSSRQMGAAFGIGSLYLLILIFAQVFTTVYDYIPVIGPLFRDRFWLVMSLPAAILSISILAVRASATSEPPKDLPRLAGIFSVASVLLLALASIAAILVTSPRPAPPPSNPASLHVLTYNIQQGYSADGQKAYPQQLGVLDQAKADFIGLQESDTNRISGGNTDLVRIYADRLNLYSDYGPSTVLGTFGIALLAGYPLGATGNAYLYSTGEQTAILHAHPQIGGKVYNIFVTHLGNGGPPIQQAEVLDLVRSEENVILMGDFNFTPQTQQYQSMRTVLDDAWVRAGSPGAPGFDPQERIDYIFVSPNLAVLSAGYHPGPQSDHPWLEAEVR